MTHPPDFRAEPNADCVLNLAEIIREVDGNHNKGAAALAEAILSHPNVGAALSAAPQQGAPSERILKIAAEVEKCALSWDCSARLLGNVTAEDIADLCDAVLTRYGAQAVPVAIPTDEWHDDDGPCLWWTFPINEPPHSGSPLDSDWPGYHTHFTRIVCPELPQSEAQP